MITSDLIRLLDDVELLSPGRWTITGRQPVELRTSGWRRRRRPAIATGELMIDEDPRRSMLRLVVTPLDRELTDAALTIDAVLTTADSTGAWLLHGTAARADDATPVTIDIRYRGVYRHGRHATAWLTVDSTLPALDGRARGDELFGHLNADAPARRDVRPTELTARHEHCRGGAVSGERSGRYARSPLTGAAVRRGAVSNRGGMRAHCSPWS